MQDNSSYEEFLQAATPPDNLSSVVSEVTGFMKRHSATDRPIVLVTSGGTTVPLEKKTVRFLDNFSSGSRGATSAEYFLAEGYAVVFLCREYSLKPYQRQFSKENFLEWFVADTSSGDSRLKASAPVEKEGKMLAVLSKYSKTKQEGTLLLVPYTTVFQYLCYLRAIAVVLNELGPRAVLYLAAAVSDFYVHPRDMAQHKIQSSDQLTPKFSHTPKMIYPLRRDWAPNSFTVTFKLETDESVLVEHAKKALANYQHQVVVANLLGTRKTTVTMVTHDSEERLYLSAEEIERGEDIEGKLVGKLVERHREFCREN